MFGSSPCLGFQLAIPVFNLFRLAINKASTSLLAFLASSLSTSFVGFSTLTSTAVACSTLSNSSTIDVPVLSGTLTFSYHRQPLLGCQSDLVAEPSYHWALASAAADAFIHAWVTGANTRKIAAFLAHAEYYAGPTDGRLL